MVRDAVRSVIVALATLVALIACAQAPSAPPPTPPPTHSHKGARLPVSTIHPSYLANAWRRAVRDVTDDEILAILPLVQQGYGRLRGLVNAYRAGVAAGVRQATPLDPPLAGFQPCPECLSVRVASMAFDLAADQPAPWVTGMLARCSDCNTLYDTRTGERSTVERPRPAANSVNADPAAMAATQVSPPDAR